MWLDQVIFNISPDIDPQSDIFSYNHLSSYIIMSNFLDNLTRLYLLVYRK